MSSVHSPRIKSGSSWGSDRDVAIAVMGATGSGKTTFINLVSGSNLRIGRGLQSCTSTIQNSVAFELDGRSVTLIDTPGFDDTNRSDADILKMIAMFLSATYERGRKLAGVIFMHRISDFRVGGISRRNFKMFRELCGDNSLKNVVIVTNMWGEVSLEVGEAREDELAREDKFFRPALDKRAQLARHTNTIQSAKAILRLLVQKKPVALRIQRELVDQGKDISQTAAGAELNRELMLQAQKHREEMKKLQEEMQAAINERDEETRRELEDEHRKLRERMAKVQDDSEKLASDYSRDKERLERMIEEARQHAERAEMEYQRQIQELRAKLQLANDVHAPEEEAHIIQQLVELKKAHDEQKGFFSYVSDLVRSLFGW